MDLLITAYSLEFHFPFGVHGNSRTHTPCLFIKLVHNNLEAYGEACLPPYLGQNEEDTLRFLKKASEYLKPLSSLPDPETVQKIMEPVAGREDAGMAALNMALNDLLAKQEHKTFRDWKKIPFAGDQHTAFTIGLGPIRELEEKIRQAKEFRILKIKLNGNEEDKILIQAIRALTDKEVFVDLNQAFQNKEMALEHILWLKDHGVVVVEQPLAHHQYEESAWLCEKSPLPVIADESIRNPDDLYRHSSSFSGINIKLMKCGGLERALEMISFARQKGLKVMLGCMAESSCGTTAMAQLIGLADFIDLDAPLLYKNDPFTGLLYQQGEIHLPDGIGLGIKPKQSLTWSI